MTKHQIEKKFKVHIVREINSYMGGRYFWSAKNEAGREVARSSKIEDMEEILEAMNYKGQESSI